ncbi:MAG: hypothetical protein C3F07_12225 [Anaerolineales bacterium]|nr:MAG: hypothetical protein C3F07_12225 [Anaerolineales bacterium]
MKRSYRFVLSVMFMGAYLLSACSGVVPVQSGVDDTQSGTTQEVVFTGAVESMSGTTWQINGQQVTVDESAVVDPNVKIGDVVRVEASVSAEGVVTVMKIETSGADDANGNSNSSNDNASNTNDDTSNTNDNTNTGDDNANSNANGNEAAGAEQEIFGVVESITADTITIDGVVYNLADFTEFNGMIAVGDQVKVHVIVNDDGTLTIREIEKSNGTGIGDDNSNSNANVNDNSNDDNSNVNVNDNGNDDNSNGNDDNSNSNSNGDDDDDNDNGSNSNDD